MQGLFTVKHHATTNSDRVFLRYSRCMTRTFSVKLTAPKATALLSAFFYCVINQSKERMCEQKRSFCDTQANCVRFLTGTHAKWPCNAKMLRAKNCSTWFTGTHTKFSNIQQQNAATPQNTCTHADQGGKQHNTSESTHARYTVILTCCMCCRLNATNKTPVHVNLR